MKNKVVILIVLLFLIVGSTFAQSKYEIYGGVSISNTNRYDNNHQAVNINPQGSPDYTLRFHVGIQRKFFEFSNVNFQLGLGIASRGCKNYLWQILPIDTIIDLHLIYLQAPINLNLRLLNGKEYYFIAGLTPSYLLFNYDNMARELSTAAVNPTLIPWQLEYKLGIRFPIINNLEGKISFNKSLTSIKRIRQFNTPTWTASTYHHTFDLTLIYKI
ncbi:MAG: hypothetical protein LC127_18020 [Chitinophagales bacterium]|nr:MAG: hypothetical protein UZ08_BCD001000054 [Candidatus Parvibacillus calidus]MCZ2340043.1 hypothetical protein [Chitinophagales bacterium]WKZ64122.1 MAG: hypothetical protein QY315_04840 [Saprospiraceae bacterium]